MWMWKRKDGEGPACLLTHCCYCPLSSATMIIATIEVILCFVLSIFLGAVPYFRVYGQGRMSFVAIMLQFAQHGCLSCVLIHGVRKNRVEYLWAWVWARSVELVTDANRLLHITALNTDYVPFSICFIASLITCFNIVVVRSYAFHMGAQRGGRRRARLVSEDEPRRRPQRVRWLDEDEEEA